MLPYFTTEQGHYTNTLKRRTLLPAARKGAYLQFTRIEEEVESYNARAIIHIRALVFSDGKKELNSNGSDDWNHYFHDIRKEEIVIK